MSSLVIDFERVEDIKLLEQLATRLGLPHFRMSAAERRFAARKALVEQVAATSPTEEVPEEVIQQAVENNRTLRNGKRNNQSSR